MIDDLLDGLGEVAVEAVGGAVELAGEFVGGAIEVVGEIFESATSSGEDEEAKKKGAQP